jgi:hypothetical protein
MSFFSPLFLVLFSVFLDYYISNTFIAPLLKIIGLMCFAFCLSEGWMVFWAITYSIITACILLQPSVYGFLNPNGSQESIATRYVGSVIFLCGATAASILCFILNRLRQSKQELFSIMEAVAVPILVSDSEGKIHFMNLMATKILELESSKESTKNIFELTAPLGAKGAMIADYLRRIEGSLESSPLKMECQGKRFEGSTQLMKSRSQNYLVVMMTEVTNSRHGGES